MTQSAAGALLAADERGLYCAAGDFWVDPWRPVPRAVVTHAHSDHATPGCGSYLCAQPGAVLLRLRVGEGARIDGIPFSQRREIGGVRVSLHPAGHILGSAQVRIEHRGQVWVVSGDYKTVPDPAAEAFEPVPCEVFISECTFGLPIYRWPTGDEVFADVRRWWGQNQAGGRTSVLFAYPLGKSQRLLCGLREAPLGPVGLHGATARFLKAYAAQGVPLVEAELITEANARKLKGSGLVVAPPSVQNTPWLRRLQPYSLAFASGWMRLRGTRRRRALDRGFVLSDHADWPGLLEAIRATGAARVGLTHGQTAPLARYLRETMGLDVFEVPSRYAGETLDGEESA